MLTDNAQKTISDNASTIVVIKGDATTAGSSFIFLAIIGSVHPINFAIITVTNIDIATTALLTSV